MRLLKTVSNALGINSSKLQWWSIEHAARRQDLQDLAHRLQQIVPDISRQETSFTGNEYDVFKKRMQQAFQCRLMLELLDRLGKRSTYTVVDIGDSAGTHMLYLKTLIAEKYGSEVSLETLSVTLAPVAVQKVQQRGLKAVLCRAENLDLDTPVDFYTSFEMIEHLHNPAIFLYNFARKGRGHHLLVTVPYVQRSRVGLHHVRAGDDKPVIAEQEHVFELNPEDWSLLFLHSGWRVIHSEIYRQYPAHIPGLSRYLQAFWQKSDFEGFWGAILQKDTRFAECYQDWEE